MSFFLSHRVEYSMACPVLGFYGWTINLVENPVLDPSQV